MVSHFPLAGQISGEPLSFVRRKVVTGWCVRESSGRGRDQLRQGEKREKIEKQILQRGGQIEKTVYRSGTEICRKKRKDAGGCTDDVRMGRECMCVGGQISKKNAPSSRGRVIQKILWTLGKQVIRVFSATFFISLIICTHLLVSFLFERSFYLKYFLP